MTGIMEKFFFPPSPTYFCSGTTNQRKGTGTVPFFISRTMEREAQAVAIAEMTETMLADDPACFLVGVSVKPVNNVKVYIDSDTGLAIDRCVRYNRALYKSITESGLYPDGAFSLEVSSPGVDEPLKLRRQYVKNAGRRVEVTRVDGTVLEGLMREVGEEDILVVSETGKGRKKEVAEHRIPFSDIKVTRVQVVFNT